MSSNKGDAPTLNNAGSEWIERGQYQQISYTSTPSSQRDSNKNLSKDGISGKCRKNKLILSPSKLKRMEILQNSIESRQLAKLDSGDLYQCRSTGSLPKYDNNKNVHIDNRDFKEYQHGGKHISSLKNPGQSKGLNGSISTSVLPSYQTDATSRSLFRSHSIRKIAPAASPYSSTEERGYYSLSDRIGCNYTLSAQSLTFKHVARLSKAESSSKNIFKQSPSKTAQKLRTKVGWAEPGRKDLEAISPALERSMSQLNLPKPGYNKLMDNLDRSTKAVEHIEQPQDSTTFQPCLYPTESRAFARHLHSNATNFVTPSPSRTSKKQMAYDSDTSEHECRPTSSCNRPLLKPLGDSGNRGIHKQQMLEIEESKFKTSLDAFNQHVDLLISSGYIASVNDMWPKRILQRLQLPPPPYNSSIAEIETKNEVLLGCMFDEMYLNYYKSIARSVVNYKIMNISVAKEIGIHPESLKFEKNFYWTNDEYQVKEWRVFRETGIDRKKIDNASDYVEVFLHSVDLAMIELQAQWLLEPPPREWDLSVISDIAQTYNQITLTNILSPMFKESLPLPVEDFTKSLKKSTQDIRDGLKKFWVISSAEIVNKYLPLCASNSEGVLTDKKDCVQSSHSRKGDQLSLCPKRGISAEDVFQSNKCTGEQTLKKSQDHAANEFLLQKRLEQEGLQNCPSSNDINDPDKVTHDELVQYNYHIGLLNSAAVLMSRQIREIAEISLKNVASFFHQFTDSSNESALLISLELSKNTEQNLPFDEAISFQPSCTTIIDGIFSYIDFIVEMSNNFPRIDNRTSIPKKLQNNSCLSPCGISLDDELVKSTKVKVEKYIKSKLEEPKQTINLFQKYFFLLNGDEEKRISKLISSYKEQYGSGEDYDKSIEMLPEFQNEVKYLQNLAEEIREQIDEMYNFSLFTVSCVNTRLFLINHTRDLANRILSLISEENMKQMKEMNIEYARIADTLTRDPLDSGELKTLQEFFKESSKTLQNLGDQLSQQVCVRANFLMKLNYGMSREETQVFVSTFDWPESTKSYQHTSLELQQKRRKEIELVVEGRQEDLLSMFSGILKRIEKLRESGTISDAVSMTKRVAGISKSLNEAELEAEGISEQESILGLDITDNETRLNELKELLGPVERLWTTVASFSEKMEHWRESPLAEVNAEDAERDADQFRRTIVKIAKDCERSGESLHNAANVANSVKRMLDDLLSDHIPLMHLLCTPGIRERHWEEICQITGLKIDAQKGRTLSTMLEVGLDKFVSAIEDTCVAASKEFSLEKALDKMVTEWDGIEFATKEYRNTKTHILCSMDEIQQILDDQIVKTQSMRASRYNKPYLERIQAWERMLIEMQDIIDNWMKVQATWLYLEPIFSSDDIMRQMPTEGSLFQRVDKTWRKNMSAVVSTPEALVVVKNAGLLDDLVQSNEDLDIIQKGLNDYLETKRLFFPRFFFLSNDELLEILAETKDPLRVQPHLKKAFDGMSKLEFQENLDITAMMSPEGERVNFPYPKINQQLINPNNSGGNVEVWLQEAEITMRKSVAYHLDQSMVDYAKKDRLQWVQEWPGQIVLAVNQTMWTMTTEKALSSKINDPSSLEKHLNMLRSELTRTVELVRGELPKLIRITLGALVVMDVHNRDTINEMVQLDVKSITDFDWLAQLRYYWIDGGHSAVTGKPKSLDCKMINTSALYAYEYLGNSMRLVITPLTDRCYRTLMGAIHLNLGGAPEGPAGTGKTETTKDLGKAIAIQCVVTNCSDGLDYLAMGKFFKGLASSGAWACFDEFNRIQLEVLSVVAQQVLCIQIAKSVKAERFMFEGTEIPLNPTCCPFITMNPGYAGRAELPDNLKVLFRTVAMMVPDYAMIAEIMLYSYGYMEAGALSKKITTTYTLCSEQLSSQSHYDYGMRAVMAVLRAAGNLKRTAGHLNEDALVLRSIIDVNLPKFLSPDVPLFNGIVSDLFPGVVLDPPDREEMLNAINDVCKSKNLQPINNFIEKIIQIYEMMIVRHGFMIVGLPLSGKTSCWKVLAEVLGVLHAKFPDNSVYTEVDTVVINPKAVTMGQLYGQFDDVSHEWTDGVLAINYRNLANNTSPARKWLLFDGPVDAVWIENMNTVLDDNRKLCLMSGEIIAMSSVMSMMFEPMDLLVASPATVSRCGMIYMEPEELGWQPLVDSWLDLHTESESSARSRKKDEDNDLYISIEQREILLVLFCWLVEPCIAFIRKETTEVSPTVDSNLVQSLLNVMEAQLIDAYNQGPKAEGCASFENSTIECVFFFSLVWSIGESCNEDGRIKFNGFIRDYMNDKAVLETVYVVVNRALQVRKWKQSEKIVEKAYKWAVPFPNKNLVYDYFFNCEKMQWCKWEEVLKRFDIPPNMSYNEIVVPTVYTAQMEHLLNSLITNDKKVLVCGPTGTGKSCYIDAIINSGRKITTDSYVSISLSFSAKTSANMTQNIVDGKLDKRRKGVYGPPLGKKAIIFVDDVNMPEVETYGAQPPIELIRQLMDNGGWYDLKEMKWRTIIDTVVVGAMGPPGGGRNSVTPRFLRHFNLLCFTEFDDDTLTRIFSTIVTWYFESKPFNPNVRKLANPIVAATLDTFRNSMKVLLPTPKKSHYTFNLRDFSRIIQGILLVEPSEHFLGNSLVRLWVHESLRVIGDRLIDDIGRDWFNDFQKKMVSKHFSNSFDKLFDHLKAGDDGPVTKSHMRSLFFGDYIDPDANPRMYAEIDVKELDVENNSDGIEEDVSPKSGMELLISCLETYLAEYNGISRKPMNLVMFLFAIEHVSRIARVLKMPGGNALLVGVGGSGRQSLTRLASFIMDCEVKQIEISKNYTMTEWREDMKDVLRTAGTSARPLVFLFSDTQIKYEGFVEDINNILNSGEIPNLFPYDERVAICESMRVFAKEKYGKSAAELSPGQLYAMFIDRIKVNLHVALACSPIGDAFRDRLRKFPSLINCCTIDWFTAWPSDALVAVAEKFLAEVEMDSDKTRHGIVATCQFFHESVKDLSDKFLRNLKRQNYVTPTSYLELIIAFMASLSTRRTLVQSARERYVIGLEKLEFAESNVSVMRVELTDLQPVLDKSKKDTDILMDEIQAQLPGVEAKRAEVQEDVAVADKSKALCEQQKASVEADLEEAIPALNEALKALDTIKPSEINEVKAMTNPPAGVKLVCEGVCVMLGIKPQRIPDPQDPSKRIMDFWGPSQKMLSDAAFIQQLKKFDKDNLDQKIMKTVNSKYISDENFSPEKAEKASKAAAGLCKWVHSMVLYDRVSKVVAPKREALKVAEQELSETLISLNEKLAELKEVEDGLGELQKQFDDATEQKQKLEFQVDLTGKKLVRAATLIESLGGEKSRWTEFAKDLALQYSRLTGDVLISAGVVAYLGPFTSVFRQEAVTEWVSRCKDLSIPCSDSPSLNSTLGDPVEIRKWNIDGLPTDGFSIDNGIIVFNSRRWPLLIDPQGQANKWIRNMEKERQLTVIKLTDADYMRTLENAVQFGYPVLLENVGEELDPSLEPLLLKQTFKQGGVLSIRLGDSTVEYSENFRFYVTTKLRNPHYLPEVSVKVTLVNFMITPSGLEDQLLGIVVAQERPDLEEQKNMLILQSAKNKRLLKEIEDKILHILSSSEGNILEDETAINTMNQSKTVADDIKKEQVIAETTELEIDEVRQGYRPVAYSSQVLFFCIDELANIEPVYQYSLLWFINLFINSIKLSDKSTNLGKRLANLDSHFTFSLYRNICRSLLEKDKLMFSFLLTISIMQGKNEIELFEWLFLLTGGVAISETEETNPVKEWLGDKQWSEFVRLSDLGPYRGLKESFYTHSAEWKSIYDSSDAHLLRFPGKFNELSPFHRLLVVRCLRPDVLVPACQNFVVVKMGQEFVKPPTFDLSLCYVDSNISSPLVFILSPGSDPISSVLKFAEMECQQADTISLGQGQGPIAERMIEKAKKEGTWVVLQNCHLAPSWMPTMEKIVEEFTTETTNEKFRLWCTTYPSNVFPASILQNGVKMTNEPPQGLRANLLGSYMSDPICEYGFLDSVGDGKSAKGAEFRRLLFSLCFFHALVRERRQFGPLGWNISYEFNESDLSISVRQLAMFLEENDSVPLHALRYCTGECNYGGRVTDDKDRRTLHCILNRFYTMDIFKDGYTFDEKQIYITPVDGNYTHYISFIEEFPLIATPDIFGLHENATITKDQNETAKLCRDILLTQSNNTGSDDSSGGSASQEDIVDGIAADILARLPDNFDMEVAHLRYPVKWEESMNTVLCQELVRFNNLLSIVRSSIKDLRKAIKGLVVMSADLEKLLSSLFYGRLPELWSSKSYPSLKPLPSYVSDLFDRVQFFGDWLNGCPPTIFWISGFFFTQAFLTGASQNYARKYTIPIDQLTFQHEVMEEDIYSTSPENGVYVQGLFLQGCRWDKKEFQLVESYAKILFSKSPILWFRPLKKCEHQIDSTYNCPVYKTSERRGTLSTTGHSTNFICFIRLPSKRPEDHWVARGVAMLSQLDD